MIATPGFELGPPRFEAFAAMVFAGLTVRYDPRSRPKSLAIGSGLRLTSADPGQVDEINYGVIFNFDAEGNFDYKSPSKSTPLRRCPPDLRISMCLREYAVFKYRGPVMAIRDTMSAIFGRWLPQSGLRRLTVRPSRGTARNTIRHPHGRAGNLGSDKRDPRQSHRPLIGGLLLFVVEGTFTITGLGIGLLPGVPRDERGLRVGRRVGHRTPPAGWHDPGHDHPRR